MNEIEKKLNQEYAIQIQGGSILMLLKMVAEKAERLEATLKLAEQLDLEVPEEIHQIMTAIDAIGSNLMQDAKKIFGEEYLAQIFGGGDEESKIVVDGGEAIN